MFDDGPDTGLVESPGMSYVRPLVMDLVRRGDGSTPGSMTLEKDRPAMDNRLICMTIQQAVRCAVSLLVPALGCRRLSVA